MAVTANTDDCVACGACVDACPLGALSVNDTVEVDEEACVECGACTSACPLDVLSL
jgi:ferredoxin